MRLLGSLTADQLTAIYQMLDERKSVSLKELHPYGNDHRKVPSNLLASVLTRLEKVDISSCSLSSEQLRTLFSKIAASSKLQHLYLSYNNLSEVQAELLVTAISRLESVRLYRTHLTTDQLSGIYRMVAERRAGTLKVLGLSGSDHRDVPSDLLASGLTRLEKLDMRDCNLSSEQLRTLFSKIAATDASSLTLQHLDLSFNNLSEVPAELLVMAISRLESVRLHWADLTTDQLTNIYRMVAERRVGRLKVLGVFWNDHSGVTQSLRVQAELNKNVRIESQSHFHYL